MSRLKVVGGVMCVGLVFLAGTAFSNSRTDDPLGVAVSPQMLLLSSDQGGEVTVHTAIPLSWVDRASVRLEGLVPIGIGADSCGNMVAKFVEAEVESIVSPPGAVLTLTGNYDEDGEPFSGSDEVQVRE